MPISEIQDALDEINRTITGKKSLIIVALPAVGAGPLSVPVDVPLPSLAVENAHATAAAAVAASAAANAAMAVAVAAAAVVAQEGKAVHAIPAPRAVVQSSAERHRILFAQENRVRRERGCPKCGVLGHSQLFCPEIE
jgi:hypothetical protein